MDVDGYKIVNVYKPPSTRLRSLDLPVFPHACFYAGDFNCRHADWGYNDNTPDGECLAGWASINCLALLYNAKDDAVNISDNFSQREFTAALQHLKPGKAPGPDFICPELILHAGAALKSWLRDFLSSCLRRLKIPKIWRRALLVAIPKSGKPVGYPKSYRLISLLYVPYKVLERLIYVRVKPLIDPLLPKEQPGFQRGKSTVDQVVLLTQNIENSFEAKKKASAVFIDLTAAYDTVWHHGLTCKLLRLLQDKHMVKMIMEFVRN